MYFYFDIMSNHGIFVRVVGIVSPDLFKVSCWRDAVLPLNSFACISYEDILLYIHNKHIKNRKLNLLKYYCLSHQITLSFISCISPVFSNKMIQLRIMYSIQLSYLFNIFRLAFVPELFLDFHELDNFDNCRTVIPQNFHQFGCI